MYQKKYEPGYTNSRNWLVLEEEERALPLNWMRKKDFSPGRIKKFFPLVKREGISIRAIRI